MKKEQGFTLIELLTVIAIIVILASVIIMSLNSARNKAKDALMQNTMSTPLVLLSMDYYENHNQNYASFCNDSETENFLGKINSLNNCKANSNQWVVCAKL